MTATIKIKNSSTAGAIPTSSDLVQGELAINVTDKTIFTENASGTVVELGKNYTGFKNRIINGAMMIDQRNAGASVTCNGANQYPVDRFVCYSEATDGVYTSQQSTDVPSSTGFRNSVKLTVTTADSSLGATQRYAFVQRIEGYNVADLNFGLSTAQTFTLSFWVKSSLTGTMGGAFFNHSFNRGYPFTYVINSANTWEQKTVTITADTTGTWDYTNNTGVGVSFSLGTGATYSGTAGAWAGAGYLSATGATNIMATNGATFYITGVQLEKGSTATSFDYRPYGTELALCQRYYYKIDAEGSATVYLASGNAETTTAAVAVSFFPVLMRAAPSALEQTGTASDYRIRVDGGNLTFSSVPTFNNATKYNATTNCAVASGLAAGKALAIRPNTSAVAYLAWSAEL